MMFVLTCSQIMLGCLALIHGVWWSLLSLVALPKPGVRPQEVRLFSPTVVVLVPAHNEERMIGATVRSLQSAPYHPRPEILVVADNCSDHTSEIARSLGASVLERRNTELRGKSFALQFAIAHLNSRNYRPDVVVVVDADTIVEPNFFGVVCSRMAAGESALQVHYRAGMASSDLGRLRRLSFLLVHWSRPLGLQRLGFGVGLKGNGMAFRWEAAEVALGENGLAEDSAATLKLARIGQRIGFEPRTSVTGFMAQDYKAAETQDRRWETGRMSLIPEALSVVGTSFANSRPRLIGQTVEAVALPLSVVCFAAVVAGFLGQFGVGNRFIGRAAIISVVTYVVVGLGAARAPMADLRALPAIPRFVGHKLKVFAKIAARAASQGNGWERTSRD